MAHHGSHEHDDHDDDHGHVHGHGHAHGHAHELTADAVTARMMIAMILNLSFVAVESTFGFLSNSVALIADAGHNFGDVLGLLCAFAAVYLARRPPGGKFTYGLGRSSVLAALVNAVLLLLACGAIAWEAIGRIASPPSVAGATVVGVAAVGIVLNGVSAWLLHAGSHGDLNRRSAYLHMLGDAAISAGVLVSGAIILLHRLELARPGGQLADRRRDSGEYLEAIARLRAPLPRRGSGRRQLDRRTVVSRPSAGRHRRARPSHLGALHDERGIDRASGGAGPGGGRGASGLPDPDPQEAVSHRSRDLADRARPLRSRLRILADPPRPGPGSTNANALDGADGAVHRGRDLGSGVLRVQADDRVAHQYAIHDADRGVAADGPCPTDAGGR